MVPTRLCNEHSGGIEIFDRWLSLVRSQVVPDLAKPIRKNPREFLLVETLSLGQTKFSAPTKK